MPGTRRQTVIIAGLALLPVVPLSAQSTNSASGTVTVLPSQQAVASAEFSQAVWAKPDHFWFRRSVPGGNAWLTVDAVNGVKEPLFDHQRLANELRVRTGVEYAQLGLPFGDSRMQFTVKYDGSTAFVEGALALEFILDQHQWRCDLMVEWDWGLVPPTDYQCLEGDPAPEGNAAIQTIPASEAVRSPDGRWVALVGNNNVVIYSAGTPNPKPIDLSTDGTRDFAYQTGSLHWSADSKTLSAWRVNEKVWTSDAIRGDVRGLVVKGEWKAPLRGIK